MRPSTALTPFLILALAACGNDSGLTGPRAQPALLRVAGAASQSRSGVPLSATCVSEDVQPPVFTYPHFLDQVIAGTCQVSHLGRSSMRLLQHVDLATGAATGTVTFTAANGDALTITQSTASTDVGPATKAFTGTATITGGTGRFANASGALELDGTLTFDQNEIGHALSTYAGWIAYSASN